jgi:hypothetical protein
MLDLEDYEQTIVNEAAQKAMQIEIGLQQARGQIAALEQELLRRGGALAATIETILKVKGLNPAEFESKWNQDVQKVEISAKVNTPNLEVLPDNVIPLKPEMTEV